MCVMNLVYHIFLNLYFIAAVRSKHLVSNILPNVVVEANLSNNLWSVWLNGIIALKHLFDIKLNSAYMVQ